jgi:pimeloyl-ACP methyl ester carboxylesterase
MATKVDHRMTKQRTRPDFDRHVPAEVAHIQAPNFLLMASELFRAGLEQLSVPLFSGALLTAPRGDGHPVLVLPGFATSDASTFLLRIYLASLGYDVHAWELGRNMGMETVGPARRPLIDRIDAIAQKSGRNVSLVGWSLGGVMARQVSAQRREHIRQIVTISSPFGGNPYASNVWRQYEEAVGMRFDHPEMQLNLAEGAVIPSVPSTAIYSKTDGIVAWENCVDPHEELTDNVEVVGSHMGLCTNPAVLILVANRLAQPDGQWRHFNAREMPFPWMYPSSGHAGA